MWGEQMTGTIFSIEEFSVYDGPGIRSTVFLKGCPLRCSWCHNPEGQLKESEMIKSPNGCIGCGTCLQTSVQKEDGSISFTEESIKNCPMNLIRVCGETVSSGQLCETLLKNKRILNAGGGVTFSGGEPFLQSKFLFECIMKLKNKLHTAIQTSGYCDADTFCNALNITDYFLFDLKLADDAMHIKYTGVSNRPILRNISALAKSGVPYVVRIPLIPGVTDSTRNLTQLAQILNDNHVSYAELLPYNKIAGGKYKMLQRNYMPGFDEAAPPQPRQDLFWSFGIRTKIM